MLLIAAVRVDRLFFQVYVARLFSHNVKIAYQELVVRANQLKLLADLEREDREREQKEKKRCVLHESMGNGTAVRA